MQIEDRLPEPCINLLLVLGFHLKLNFWYYKLSSTIKHNTQFVLFNAGLYFLLNRNLIFNSAIYKNDEWKAKWAWRAANSLECWFETHKWDSCSSGRITQGLWFMIHFSFTIQPSAHQLKTMYLRFMFEPLTREILLFFRFWFIYIRICFFHQ